MKVLLKVDVENLGYAGEVREVAAGYGRNYLVPQGLAVKASPSMMKQAEIWRKKADNRRAELRAEYEALSARIKEVTLTFSARASEDTGKLFGSVTTSQIADALNEAIGTEIDRRKVGNEPLRQLGQHSIVVRLSGEFQPEFNVVILQEGVTEVEMEQPVVAEDLMEVAEVIATEPEVEPETE